MIDIQLAAKTADPRLIKRPAKAPNEAGKGLVRLAVISKGSAN